MSLSDKIWYYIGSRVDNDNILPSEDEIYTKFIKFFELYDRNPDIIAETVNSYVGCSSLEEVKIEWEGNLGWNLQ